MCLPRPLDAGAEVGLMQASPAPRNPVLRRPPVLEDYVNVTSTGGNRAFLVLRADSVGAGVQVGAVWPQVGGWSSPSGGVDRLDAAQERVLDVVSLLGPWGPFRKSTWPPDISFGWSLSPFSSRSAVLLPSSFSSFTFLFSAGTAPIPVASPVGICG